MSDYAHHVGILQSCFLKERMKILSTEYVVEHSGNTFKRTVENGKPLWKLNQKSDEFDLWSGMDPNPSLVLEIKFKELTATFCENCFDEASPTYPIVVLECGHALCTYCAKDGCCKCP